MSASAAPALVKELLAGSRRALAKTITLLEGTRADQRKAAEEALALLMPKSGQSLRIGISGVPGVGKSTFIEALGTFLLKRQKNLAVLAVDPTSPLSGGSILGDRVRMEELSRDQKVFIRPSPSGLTHGGVARHTREAIIACEAAGYGTILVETVGVGQSEAVVASMVDVFLILHLPNSGDEIQGLKKGVLELADLVVVTKADGDRAKDAKIAKEQLERALMMTRGHESWSPPVLLVSSTEATGLDALWQQIEAFVTRQKDSGELAGRRARQAAAWYRDELGSLLLERLTSRADLAKLVKETETQVLAGKKVPSLAAAALVERLLPPAP